MLASFLTPAGLESHPSSSVSRIPPTRVLHPCPCPWPAPGLPPCLSPVPITASRTVQLLKRARLNPGPLILPQDSLTSLATRRSTRKCGHRSPGIRILMRNPASHNPRFYCINPTQASPSQLQACPSVRDYTGHGVKRARQGRSRWRHSTHNQPK